MRIVVLEDEPPAQAILVSAIAAARADARVEACLATVAEARVWFAEHPAPDLVVSDIQLADGIALSLFADGTVTSPVVFATAYDDYLLDAFRCISVDYLLKPIATDDVSRAFAKLDRLKGALAASDASALADVLRAPRRRVLLRRGPELRAVSVEEVAYFVARDKLVLAVLRDGSDPIVDRTLTQLESELDSMRFFRANRGTLVSASAVRAFRSAGKGRILLTLAPPPADDVVVSQESAAAFRAWIDQ